MTDKLLSAVELAAQHTDAEKFKAFEWLRELALSSSTDAPMARVAFDTWAGLTTPIDMVLYCPKCGAQHIDAPEPSIMAMDGAMFGGDWPGRWTNPPHKSHLCSECSHIWRPADVPTNGVAAVKTAGKDDSPIATKAAPEAEPSLHAKINRRGRIAPYMERFEKVVEEAYFAGLADGATPPTAPLREPTEEMITAYLTANDAYWKRVDDLPTKLSKWRDGTPSEATRVSLRAALAAAPTHPAQAEKKETQ